MANALENVRVYQRGVWGHISCNCSQMLVKVHQGCTYVTGKIVFLESLKQPEAAMLPSCLVYLCVFVALSNAASLGMRKEIRLRHIHASTGVSVHAHLNFYFSLCGGSVFCF